MSRTSILAISDVHIGCPRLNPFLLHERFNKFLYPQITKDISILFICGDFFDSLINLSNPSSREAMAIIKELKSLCRSVGCDLRVLRGTFSHDRDQPLHFIHREDPNDNTVRMFDKISFEYHEKTGLNIIYIPDNHGSKDIYKDISDLLVAHNVEKADILIHHGYFIHMFPPGVKPDKDALDVDLIQKYVKGCVLNGHVHRSSIFKNVISIGSFDRLAHDEDGPKGFYRIDIDGDQYKFNFIENKEANKFITIDLLGFGEDHESAVKYFCDEWSKLTSTFIEGHIAHVRVKTDDKTINDACRTAAREIWKWTVVDAAKTIKRDQVLENVNTCLDELPVITPGNIETLLMPIIERRSHKISPEDLHQIITTVAEAK